MTGADFLEGLAIGLAVSGVTLLVTWFVLRRLRVQLAHGGLEATPGPAAQGGVPDAAQRIAAPASPDPAESARADSPVPAPNPPISHVIEMLPSAATLAGPPPSNGHAIVSEATVSLSHRVLLHLYRQGIPRADEVAPRSHSQAGMMEQLGARQGALAGVLRRLEAAGVVRVATTHVRGGERRVKVYMLTDRGIELAKEISSDRSARNRSPPSFAKR